MDSFSLATIKAIKEIPDFNAALRSAIASQYANSLPSKFDYSKLVAIKDPESKRYSLKIRTGTKADGSPMYRNLPSGIVLAKVKYPKGSLTPGGDMYGFPNCGKFAKQDPMLASQTVTLDLSWAPEVNEWLFKQRREIHRVITEMIVSGKFQKAAKSNPIFGSKNEAETRARLDEGVGPLYGMRFRATNRILRRQFRTKDQLSCAAVIQSEQKEFTTKGLELMKCLPKEYADVGDVFSNALRAFVPGPGQSPIKYQPLLAYDASHQLCPDMQNIETDAICVFSISGATHFTDPEGPGTTMLSVPLSFASSEFSILANGPQWRGSAPDTAVPSGLQMLLTQASMAQPVAANDTEEEEEIDNLMSNIEDEEQSTEEEEPNKNQKRAAHGFFKIGEPKQKKHRGNSTK